MVDMGWDHEGNTGSCLSQGHTVRELAKATGTMAFSWHLGPDLQFFEVPEGPEWAGLGSPRYQPRGHLNCQMEQ